MSKLNNLGNSGKLHIVGGGAIGCLLAASAQLNSVPYNCYPRSIETMPTKALWLDGQQIALKPPETCPIYLDKADVLVFPLKVYQLKDAILRWRPYLTQKKPTIVLLHNGMGGLEVAHELLGHDYPLLVATTSHGALKVASPNGNIQVKYTGLGATQIGVPEPAEPRPQTLPALLKTTPLLANAVALLDRALPPVQYHPAIDEALWTKLSINAVINPLTAIHNIQNKHIADAEFEQTRSAICHEFTLVANAYGFNFVEDEVHADVLCVATATGENYSSMHQDVSHGRQTEIDAINGYLVDKAKKKGIHVPVNTLLVERVQALKL
ncbi:ketopantoate reductase family protein [Alteromonas gracilis]|uniref:ketopantoate reductase family protein n=1 Tax=Alteromonas gracilis TaxID=1479524 RepID=UPI003736E326